MTAKLLQFPEPDPVGWYVLRSVYDQSPIPEWQDSFEMPVSRMLKHNSEFRGMKSDLRWKLDSRAVPAWDGENHREVIIIQPRAAER